MWQEGGVLKDVARRRCPQGKRQMNQSQIMPQGTDGRGRVWHDVVGAHVGPSLQGGQGTCLRGANPDLTLDSPTLNLMFTFTPPEVPSTDRSMLTLLGISNISIQSSSVLQPHRCGVEG